MTMLTIAVETLWQTYQAWIIGASWSGSVPTRGFHTPPNTDPALLKRKSKTEMK